MNRFFVKDFTPNRWLSFYRPKKVISTKKAGDVLPLLSEIDKLNRQGYFAIGFLSYEASAAFDNSFATHTDDDFPLMWFGIFDEPQRIVSLPPGKIIPSTTPSWQLLTTKEDYRKIHKKIKLQIAAGNTYQVNFTTRLVNDRLSDPWTAFHRLLRSQDTPYAAFLPLKDWTILSLSPELFFLKEGDVITCRPMKGTAPRGLTPQEDLFLRNQLRTSKKDRAENLMIVDMVRNDLGRIALPGSVKVPELFSIEKYPTLWQMTSTVQARTKASLPDIFKALFPAASVTGAPKVKTTEIIAKLETTPRQLYTGSLGVLFPDGKARFSIAIRTITVNNENHRSLYGVGSGIVWDSKPEREWEEIQMKTGVLSFARPSFELLETLRWSPASGFFLLELHLARLKSSAEYFDFQYHEEDVRKQLLELSFQCRGKPCRIRVTLNKEGTLSGQADPLKKRSFSLPVNISLSAKPVSHKNVFLYHKTTHRDIYDAALKQNPDLDDVLLWNEKGELTESCFANVVVRKGDRLLTPPVTCGLLAGTFRSQLLRKGVIQERILPMKELNTWEDIFLINSIRGWQRTVFRNHRNANFIEEKLEFPIK